MNLYVGVDGGGTKTKIALWGPDLNQTVIVDGGASRPTLVGFTVARDLIVELVSRALNAIGSESSNLKAMSVCLSGIDSELHAAKMKQALESKLSIPNLEVLNDSFAALTAGTLGKPGIAMISGTGSVAVGERNDGLVARAGGYGSLLGDEGSGFDIGRKGLGAAILSYEQRGKKTILWERAANFYKIQHPLELLNEFYTSETDVSRMAQFASVVIKSAEQDDVAERIVKNAITDYVNLVRSIRQQLMDPLDNTVVLAGGLFENYETLALRLRERLRTDKVLVLRRPPVLGALVRAVIRGGHPMNSDIQSELESQFDDNMLNEIDGRMNYRTQ